MSSSPQFIPSDKFNPALFASDTDTFTLGSADLRYVRIGSNAFLNDVQCSSLTLNGIIVDLTPISNITNGTAQADKAIVLDSFRDISDVNNINSTGRFSMVNTDYGLSHSFTTGGTCELVSYNSGTDASIGTYTNHPFSLTTNFIDRLRINAGGNVSIGNANNTYKLDVEGTTMTNGLKIRSTGSLTPDTPNFTVRARNGTGFDSGLQIGADSQELLNASNIGFWSPAFSVLTMYLSSSTGQNCVHMRPQAASDVAISMPDVGLCVGDTALIRDALIISSMPLSNSNNRTPQTKLRVIGGSNYVDGTYQKVAEFCNSVYGNTLSIQCSITSSNPVWLGTTTASQLRFGCNNATVMTMREDSLIIGSTSSALAPLHIATTFAYQLGSPLGLDTVWRLRTNSGVSESASSPITYNIGIYCNSYIVATALCMVSDKRRKCEFADIDIDHVERFYDTIKPQSYCYKTNMTIREYGLVAQDCLKRGFSDLVSAIPNEELKGVIDDPEVDLDGVEFNVQYQRITMFNQIMIKKMKDELKELRQLVEALTSKPALAKWLSKK